MKIEGSCLCGAARFEITGPLSGAGNCHCGMCRKFHGAAFGSWALVDPDHFRWTHGAEHVQGYESSPGAQRCFCRHCGSPLAGTDRGRVTAVVLGAIDGDPGVRPGMHLFVGSKAPWYEITDSLPQFETWPPAMIDDGPA